MQFVLADMRQICETATPSILGTARRAASHKKAFGGMGMADGIGSWRLFAACATASAIFNLFDLAIWNCGAELARLIGEGRMVGRGLASSVWRLLQTMRDAWLRGISSILERIDQLQVLVQR